MLETSLLVDSTSPSERGVRTHIAQLLADGHEVSKAIDFALDAADSSFNQVKLLNEETACFHKCAELLQGAMEELRGIKAASSLRE